MSRLQHWGDRYTAVEASCSAVLAPYRPLSILDFLSSIHPSGRVERKNMQKSRLHTSGGPRQFSTSRRGRRTRVRDDGQGHEARPRSALAETCQRATAQTESPRRAGQWPPPMGPHAAWLAPLARPRVRARHRRPAGGSEGVRSGWAPMAATRGCQRLKRGDRGSVNRNNSLPRAPVAWPVVTRLSART